MALIILAALIVLLGIVIKFFANLRILNAKIWYVITPPQHFLFGHALQFTSTTTILGVLYENILKYGKFIRLNVGFCFPFLLVADVKLLEYILTSHKIIDKSTDYRFFKRWLGNGLLTSNGPKWARMRKILTPAFHFQILEEFIDIFNSASDVLIKKLGEKEEVAVNIYPYMTKYTFDIICESAMGTSIDTNSAKLQEYERAILELGHIYGVRAFEPLKQVDFLYCFSRDYWKERRAIRIIHAYNKAVIEKRKKEKPVNLEAPEVDDFGRKRRLAFLDLLLKSNVDGKPLNDQEILDEVNTFMFAGHDTTSTALSFILYCLSLDKKVQEKLVEELHTIFKDDKNRHVSYNDLKEMKYMDMVIKESLRLYPPVPMFAREIETDVSYYGGILPANVPLTIFTFGLHRDPDLYPDPEKFDPERFTQESQAKRNPFSYIPFSAGPRNCIGQRFAMYEMKTTLANLLRKFEVNPVPDQEIVLAFQLVLKPATGLYVKFKRREF